MSNTIQIKRSSTTTEVPELSDLVEGEFAVNLTDMALFTRNADDEIVRFGLIESTSTSTNAVARFDGTKWVEAPSFEINSSGVVSTDADINVTDADIEVDGDGTFIGDGSGLTDVDAASLFGYTLPSFVLDDPGGDFELGGTLYYNSTPVHTGFNYMHSLTQAEYDALTPDANTLYFIEEV